VKFADCCHQSCHDAINALMALAYPIEKPPQ
jgi:hypothetical protein